MARAIVLFTGVAAAICGAVFRAIHPILGSGIAFGLSIYASVVEMRVLGLLCYSNEKRLGWFDWSRRTPEMAR